MPGLGIHLVIDTCVSDCSDRPGVRDARSVLCRAFLRQVQTLRYSVAYTREIRQEWDRNRSASAFFVRWRTWMRKRGRLAKVEADLQLREDIRRMCEKGRIVQKSEIGEVLKDSPLVEAALARDKRIASLDESARERFRRLCRGVAALRVLVWLNPECPSERVIEWLQGGAKLDERRMLGCREPR